MDITQLLSSSIGKSLVSSVTEKLNLDDQNQAVSAISAAIPSIMSALQDNASTKEGEETLNKAVEDHGGILDNITSLFGGGSNDTSSSLVTSLLGNKASGIADAISAKSGLASGQSSQLMGLVLPMLMGFLNKGKGNDAGGIGSLIGGLMGGGNSSSAGGLMDIAASLLGGTDDKKKDNSAGGGLMDMAASLLGGAEEKKKDDSAGGIGGLIGKLFK